MFHLIKTSSRIVRLSLVLIVITTGLIVNAFAVENPNAFNGDSEYSGMGSTVPEKIGENQYRIVYGIDFRNTSESSKSYSAYFLFRYAPGITIDSYAVEAIGTSPPMPKQNVYFLYDPQSKWKPVSLSSDLVNQIEQYDPKNPIMVNADGGSTLRAPSPMGTIAPGALYKYQITVEATVTKTVQPTDMTCSPFQDKTQAFTLHRGVMMADSVEQITSGVSHVLAGVCRAVPENVVAAPSPSVSKLPATPVVTPTSMPVVDTLPKNPAPNVVTPDLEELRNPPNQPTIGDNVIPVKNRDGVQNQESIDSKTFDQSQEPSLQSSAKDDSQDAPNDRIRNSNQNENVVQENPKNLFNENYSQIKKSKEQVFILKDSSLIKNSQSSNHHEKTLVVFLMLLGVASSTCFAFGLRKNIKQSKLVEKEVFDRESDFASLDGFAVSSRRVYDTELRFIDVYGAHEAGKLKARAAMPVVAPISKVASKARPEHPRFDLAMRIWNELMKRTTKEKVKVHN